MLILLMRLLNDKKTYRHTQKLDRRLSVAWLEFVYGISNSIGNIKLGGLWQTKECMTNI